jgi:putative ABC transport system substrate-binding protein
MTGGVQVVETGLVNSLARPGTNVTGVTWDVSTEEVGKRLELFKDLVPSISHMVILWDPSQPGVAAYWPDVRLSAKALGVTIDAVPASDKQTLERALARMAQDRPGALFVWTAPIFFIHQRPICEWAVKTSVPTLVLSRQYVEAGCLMSYGPSVTGIYREAARYVDKILRGAKAAELPVSRPSKFELVINARTARSLSLAIPPSLLLRADYVIE